MMWLGVYLIATAVVVLGGYSTLYPPNATTKNQDIIVGVLVLAIAFAGVAVIL